MDTDSDSDSPLSDVLVDDSLVDTLKQWANHFEVKAVAVDRLLKILKQHGLQNIPSCSRMLLKTPRTVKLGSVSNMEYHHFGLTTMINRCLKNVPERDIGDVNSLILTLNIDGLPLFKSTKSSVWPILCCITNITSTPVFPVSVCVGGSKPANLDFMQDAIRDLNNAMQEGIAFNGKQLPVSVSCIICDAPARAMVKCSKLYSGYYGCDKCSQRGHFVGRMTYMYPCIKNLPLRTDEAFRNNDNAEHHRGVSPILELNSVNMIDDFPLDYLHQVCLGVMKKLLLLWKRGPRTLCRLSAASISRLSTRLIDMRQNIPREFARKPRSLDEIDRWKATEFRQFLLYTGQFVLKDILPEANYHHFMSLSVALCILVNHGLVVQHHHYTHQLLEHFVSKGSQLYGAELLVYNVHSLLHLERDALKFGDLNKCAAWNFENYLKCLKRKVRTGKSPAVQLVKRIMESTNDVDELPAQQHKIRCTRPDNAYTTNSGKYCEVVKIVNERESTYQCRVYHAPEALFMQPCDSHFLGICKFRDTNYAIQILHSGILTGRCIMVQRGSDVIFLPLLHDY